MCPGSVTARQTLLTGASMWMLRRTVDVGLVGAGTR
jgi:hypothetical protein